LGEGKASLPERNPASSFETSEIRGETSKAVERHQRRNDGTICMVHLISQLPTTAIAWQASASHPLQIELGRQAFANVFATQLYLKTIALYRSD